MAVIIGVDPGLKGGYAAVEALPSGRMQIVSHMRTPLLIIGGRKYVCPITTRIFINDRGPALRGAIIEQVSSMPKQGVASTFTFGRVAGATEAVFIEHAGPVEFVTPTVWKRYFKISSKRESLDLASYLFPPYAGVFKIKANEGVAEAALLACYRIRQLQKLAA